ncbi:MAG TPA: hypothetical protein VE546_13835 [Streptomyces sp.]|uniref:hypothetical protein n=1 Tax=Streptomyces sp. TaxID=1931 RepID=UPI002D2D6A1E|nr:hypothetical protein [Streptomyces sp.]HZG04628.1 hypothetical protein [Streptomyces sp.]
MRLIRKAALGATALTAAVALSGCSGGGSDKAAGERNAEPRSIVQALRAVAKKTDEARTAKVEMTMSMPGAAGGEMKMSGVTGWNPTVMDVTATGSALAQDGGPGEMRMLWVDNVMYMQVDEESAESFGGKPWLKMDLQAMAEKSGDENLVKSMTGGLQDMNQDPAQQMGLLLDSPNIKRVGKETIDGVATEHYSGTLTMKEALEANSSTDFLTEEERKELLDGMEKSGVKGFDIEVWVDERDYPAKIDMTMDSPEGTMTISQRYSDYGTPVSVKAPPAGETTDLMEMFEELGKAGQEQPSGF